MRLISNIFECTSKREWTEREREKKLFLVEKMINDPFVARDAEKYNQLHAPSCSPPSMRNTMRAKRNQPPLLLSFSLVD